MCGIILSLINKHSSKNNNRPSIRELSHRGPEFLSEVTKSNYNYNLYMSHAHLVINGVAGTQPFDTDGVISIVNGEIYNYNDFKDEFDLKTDSDCEIINHLYLKYGNSFINKLKGQFSIVIYDSIQQKLIVTRDPIGITSLYEGSDNENNYFVSSEMKAIEKHCNRELGVFKPGKCKVYSLNTGLVSYSYNNSSIESFYMKNKNITCSDIYDLIDDSLSLRLTDDCGFLLSGGLDSSLLCALASRKRKIKTFSIGLEGSPDLKAARIVADHIGSDHHEFYFTIEEGINSLNEVIYFIESYDVTTVRASTPMFLLGKKIKNKFPNMKVLISGEGSDELFGGYLYFNNAPTLNDFHNECIDRVSNLHLSDCLRAHKTLLAHSLEVRVPFLDTTVVNNILSMCPSLKQHTNIEKEILRLAFQDLLPDEIVWRQKDQMSDAVGYNWIDELKCYSDSLELHDTYFHNRPLTNEAKLYRKLFQDNFKNVLSQFTVKQWNPKWSDTTDPSGKEQKHFKK